MDPVTPSQWIARRAQRLGDHWHTVEPSVLEEVAVDIWQNPKLRELPPEQAARS